MTTSWSKAQKNVHRVKVTSKKLTPSGLNESDHVGSLSLPKASKNVIDFTRTDTQYRKDDSKNNESGSRQNMEGGQSSAGANDDGDMLVIQRGKSNDSSGSASDQIEHSRPFITFAEQHKLQNVTSPSASNDLLSFNSKPTIRSSF